MTGDRVILYCRACNENHRFTEGDVERIVYALLAELSDSRSSPGAELVSDYGELIDCLDDVLFRAGCIELYYEHVENQVENRLLTHRDQEPV